MAEKYKMFARLLLSPERDQDQVCFVLAQSEMWGFLISSGKDFMI